jgi:hypothetical protein
MKPKYANTALNRKNSVFSTLTEKYHQKLWITLLKGRSEQAEKHKSQAFHHYQ